MTILFDGIALGVLLFLISVGLSVTLGLMNFVNLAHGAFAMLGGYVCVFLLGRFGVPFLAALPIVTLVSALDGCDLRGSVRTSKGCGGGGRLGHVSRFGVRVVGRLMRPRSPIGSPTGRIERCNGLSFVSWPFGAICPPPGARTVRSAAHEFAQFASQWPFVAAETGVTER